MRVGTSQYAGYIRFDCVLATQPCSHVAVQVITTSEQNVATSGTATTFTGSANVSGANGNDGDNSTAVSTSNTGALPLPLVQR
jgi:hypothetical protein